LQKGTIRIDLNRKHIGNIQDAGTFAEILADAFYLSERISHISIVNGEWLVVNDRKNVDWKKGNNSVLAC